MLINLAIVFVFMTIARKTICNQNAEMGEGNYLRFCDITRDLNTEYSRGWGQSVERCFQKLAVTDVDEKMRMLERCEQYAHTIIQRDKACLA